MFGKSPGMVMKSGMTGFSPFEVGELKPLREGLKDGVLRSPLKLGVKRLAGVEALIGSGVGGTGRFSGMVLVIGSSVSLLFFRFLRE